MGTLKGTSFSTSSSAPPETSTKSGGASSSKSMVLASSLLKFGLTWIPSLGSKFHNAIKKKKLPAPQMFAATLCYSVSYRNSSMALSRGLVPWNPTKQVNEVRTSMPVNMTKHLSG